MAADDEWCQAQLLTSEAQRQVQAGIYAAGHGSSNVFQLVLSGILMTAGRFFTIGWLCQKPTSNNYWPVLV